MRRWRKQFGVFARRQAARRALRASDEPSGAKWTMGELFPAVYRLPGTTRTGRQRAMAGVLWAGDTRRSRTRRRLVCCGSTRSKSRLHLTVHPRAGRRRERLDAASLREAAAQRHGHGRRDSVHFGDSDDHRLRRCSTTKCSKLRSKHARRLGLTCDSSSSRADELCGRGGRARAASRLLAVQRHGERAMESRLEVKLAGCSAGARSRGRCASIRWVGSGSISRGRRRGSRVSATASSTTALDSRGSEIVAGSPRSRRAAGGSCTSPGTTSRASRIGRLDRLARRAARAAISGADAGERPCGAGGVELCARCRVRSAATRSP